ncbi:DegV family protein, partial [Deinococcus pimensis]|uniref:DegV family protein n=1 Tax=Deinococcus pimensis TaxID=309888 RepID=UPI00047F05BF
MTSDTAKFDVVTDGGCDFPEGLLTAPFAPFSVHFGNTSHLASELDRARFFEQLRSGQNHPTTSQPTPQQFMELFAACERPTLCLTISSGLSGSLGAADGARRAGGFDVQLHDTRTLSCAQA